MLERVGEEEGRERETERKTERKKKGQREKEVFATQVASHTANKSRSTSSLEFAN